MGLVARDGWRLLPHYRFDPAPALWHHRAGSVEPSFSLHDIRYEAGTMQHATQHYREPETRLAHYLEDARAVLANPPPVVVPDGATIGRDFEDLRWFWLPGEVTGQP